MFAIRIGTYQVFVPWTRFNRPPSWCRLKHDFEKYECRRLSSQFELPKIFFRKPIAVNLLRHGQQFCGFVGMGISFTGRFQIAQEIRRRGNRHPVACPRFENCDRTVADLIESFQHSTSSSNKAAVDRVLKKAFCFQSSEAKNNPNRPEAEKNPANRTRCSLVTSLSAEEVCGRRIVRSQRISLLCVVITHACTNQILLRLCNR